MPLPKPRAQQADLVRKGMKPVEVLNVIGLPDYIELAAWEYDMDAERPFTLTVTFGENGVVSALQTSPAAWQRSDRRDQVVAYY